MRKLDNFWAKQNLYFIFLPPPLFKKCSRATVPEAGAPSPDPRIVTVVYTDMALTRAVSSELILLLGK